MLQLLSQLQDLPGCGPLRLFDYVTFRAFGAFITGFLICILLGPSMVAMLKRFRTNTVNRLDGLVDPKFIDAAKNKTPSMGGILIVGSILVSTLLWADCNKPIVIAFLAVMLALALLGFIDDYSKIAKQSRDGISARMKLLFQFIIASCAVFYMYSTPTETGDTINNLMLPFYNKQIAVTYGPIENLAAHWGVFLQHGVTATLIAFMISSLTMVSASNAVNLTDGKDGLATGCMIIAAFAYMIIAYLCSHMKFAAHLDIPHIPAAGEVVVFTAGLIGACVGYLWWNCHPASMFMGDTGSLALGGCIGMIAVLVRQEIILFLIGGVFVMEALSVIIQVSYFKWTKGKRIFLCTPIHHHFEQLGWKETQIVTRFWILGIIFAILGLATLKLR